jgi:hypothetical protein
MVNVKYQALHKIYSNQGMVDAIQSDHVASKIANKCFRYITTPNSNLPHRDDQHSTMAHCCLRTNDELSQLALDKERWITHDYASEDELSQLALDNERWISHDYASEDELSQLALDNERWITHDYASEDELSQLALDNERWISHDYASEDELSQLALDNERWITHDYASEDELSQLALDKRLHRTAVDELHRVQLHSREDISDKPIHIMMMMMMMMHRQITLHSQENILDEPSQDTT